MSTAIAYGTNGGDVWRMRLSVASLRKLGITNDIFVLTDGAVIGDPYINKECRVVDISDLMRHVGFFPDGWNREWPYASLAQMFSPLVPELAPYSKLLRMDTDVLATSDRFKLWLDHPTRGFEVIGASGDTHTTTYRRTDDIDTQDCFDTEYKRKCMEDRIWNANPRATHIHINPGVCLWDLDLLRKDIPWYVTRLQWFWEAELRGKVRHLDESFVNSFTDSTAMLCSSLHVMTGGRTKFIQPSVVEPGAIHFMGNRGGERPDAPIVKYAREHGLYDICDKAVAAAGGAGSPPTAKVYRAVRPGGGAVPAAAGSVGGGSTCVPESGAVNRVCVVHITDGNEHDQRRMAQSIHSLCHYSKLKFDVAVISNTEICLPDDVGREVAEHGACLSVVGMYDVLQSVGMSRTGWSRVWPFEVLYRLGIPLHPAFDRYDRVVYMDNDTLVLSSAVDNFLVAPLPGVEVGGAVDIVQEEHNRIARVLGNDIRKDHAERLRRELGWRLSVRGYINAGVLLLNMPEIKRNIAWYKERLGMFWDAAKDGKVGFLDQDFVNTMMSVDSSFSPVFNWFNRDNHESSGCVIRHYCGGRFALMDKHAKDHGIYRSRD